ncbi:hypothetical protein FSP39_019045 [Pinctada imbricata]|uniref:Uncharacterized protein n=1 Tax=Pinctada imbricata TaxID=66713 RepID=A0AA88Y8Z6_PINIB|nr:hypothetical protein FSP39_019045 [Pinctada imbricata]
MLSWRLPCMSGPLSDDEDEDLRREEEARREEQEWMTGIKEECDRLEREAKEERRREEELALGFDAELELPHVEISLLEVSP